MNLSYWEEKYYFEDNDLTIVGAGIVGLSTAIAAKVKRPEMKILILERSTLPSGASTKNAGFACFGSVSELASDSKSMTYDEQCSLIKMRWQGLQLLQSNVSKNEMSYRSRGGIEVLDPTDEIQMEALAELTQYNDMVHEAIGLKNCFSAINQELSTSFYPMAIYNQYEGELNPMHMMAALQQKAMALGINILYGMEVTAVTSSYIQLVDRSIKSSKIAICTNGLTQSLYPKLAMQAVRNQVYVTEVLDSNPLRSCYHFDQGYVYFREIDNRILIGGARNLYPQDETTDQFGQTEELQHYLQTFVESRILGHSTRFEYQWSGILGVGETKTPILMEIEDAVYVAVRLGGMGVAIGSGLGHQLADIICD